ncbi:Ferredoxin [Pseudoloma neurophilia]|uniref:2Fe-2S ferredoxin n=1 Tax=Pseudoloma neurophilia TaxID=146866 RepID=A0A0R0LUG9_9MICR|nr:Ferredoxin [Pseudoloma neurophilia]
MKLPDKSENNNNRSQSLLTRFFFFDDKPHEIFSRPDQTLLEAAHGNKIDLEGACEGSLACSTCHVILDKKVYDKLEEPSDREYDLLDQAYMPTSTSRLGCQVKCDERLQNATVKIPKATRNMAVDGFKPKPH